ELNRRIGQLHHFGEFASTADVIFRAQGTDLPAPPHLVAEAPIFDVEWLLVTMLSSQIRPICISGSVAVLNPGLCFVHRPIAHVDADVWLGVNRPAIANELISAKAV